MYAGKKTLLFFSVVLCLLFASCQSAMVSNRGERDKEFRGLQSDIRDGETGLAVTGAELKQTSEQLEESKNDIADTSRELEKTSGEIEQSLKQLGNASEQLEQSITNSEGNEQEIGELLQRIRTRKVTGNIQAE